MVTVTVLLSSGTKMRFFWRLTCLRVMPEGLNLVARIRLLYLPAILEPLPVIAQIFAIQKLRRFLRERYGIMIFTECKSHPYYGYTLWYRSTGHIGHPPRGGPWLHGQCYWRPHGQARGP